MRSNKRPVHRLQRRRAEAHFPGLVHGFRYKKFVAFHRENAKSV